MWITLPTTESEIPSTPVIPAVYKRFAHLVENIRNQRPKLEEPTEKTVIGTDKSQVDIVKTVDTEKTDSYRAVPWLPLNDKWSFYEKLIFNVDSLCVLAAGRSQPCIFHKNSKTLENVLADKSPRADGKIENFVAGSLRIPRESSYNARKED